MLASFVFAMLSHACRCRFEEAGPRPGSTRASRGSSNLATLLDSAPGTRASGPRKRTAAASRSRATTRKQAAVR